MNFLQYLSKSKGDFPPVGVKGVESEWMMYQLLPLPTGSLWVGDPWEVDADSVSVALAPGRCSVLVKGMNFKGHRRASRIRVVLRGVDEPEAGKKLGRVSTDVGAIGACDFGQFEEQVRKKHLRKYGKDLEAALDAGALGYIRFDYGRNANAAIGRMVLAPAGLGDGTFTVYALRSGRRDVGVEVELLPPGFKLEKEIPRLS